MNVQEVRPGVWKLRWELPRDADGGKHQRTRTVHGRRREAEAAWVREADRLAATRGQTPGPRGLTVDDVLTRWLEEGASHWRPATADNYAMMARLYLRPALGPLRLDRLTPAHIAGAVRDWRQRTRGARPGAPAVSPRMVRYALQLTREALGAAVRWGWLGANPAQDVAPPPPSARQPTWWTVDEMAHFLRATAADSTYGVLYRVALMTGLRQGELLALRWDAIEWDGPALWVRASRDQRGRTGQPKTARGLRRLPIDAETAAALRVRQAQRDADAARLGTDYADAGLVWQTRVGTALSPRNLGRRFRSDCERAGLPRVRFHDLRHSHASALEAAGVDARRLADRLGHAQLSFTLQTYTHARTEAQRPDVDALAGSLESPAADGYLLDTRRVSSPPPAP